MRRRDLLPLLGAAAAARPAGARAQPKPMRVIGYLGTVASAPNLAAFLQGLGEAGYVEGRNLAIEYRWSEGQYDRMPPLAAELVARKVDMMVTSGPSGIAAAKAATSTIPIVFFGGGDLIAAGIIASLARPGGNITGISIFGRELNPKRFELLAQLVPHAPVIALLVNPTQPTSGDVIRDVTQAAHANGRTLVVLKASSEAGIDAALASLAQHNAGGLVVEADPYFNVRREQIVALAARYGMPATYEWRQFADAGGLVSYGPNLVRLWHQTGAYAGRVLAGADPATLPIQQPTTLELVINLRTARTLGLKIPPPMLARADEVIE